MGSKGISRNKGEANPFFSKKHTPEALEKMRLAHLGQKRPPRDPEWSKRISEAKKGKFTGEDNPFFGKHHTEETKMVLSRAHIADPKFKREGEEHWNWQGGISCANHQARNTQDLKSWRRAVYQRDNYTCQRCGVKGTRKHRLEAHHIKAFAQYPDLRFEVNNGITFCKDDHKYEHTRLNLEASIEYEKGRGQRNRIKYYEHRLEVLEQLNIPELIRERGYLSYWTDRSTRYLPRRIPTKEEAEQTLQFNLLLDEAFVRGKDYKPERR